MKNILYIGPYREHNGLGRSAKRHIDSLITNSNINLAIRPIYYTKKISIDDINIYNEFEENSFSYYDAVIQHGYPDTFEYNASFGKHIGIVEIETRLFQHSGWVEKMNLLDEIIVGSIFSLNSCYESGVNKPIKISPCPYNISKYTTQHPDFFTYQSGNRPFIFYTIGNYNEKKNIKNIIKAFLLAFNNNDNVKLFIKTEHNEHENDSLNELVEYDIAQIKKIIRKEHNETCDIDILCGDLKDIDIIRLHQSSNCYINTVRADGFGNSAIEAALADKLVINTKNIGSNTYINSTNGIIVDSESTNVQSSSFYNKNIFTINELWHEPNINSIIDAMRLAYQIDYDVKQKLVSNFNKSLFDENAIGKMIL